MKRRSFLLSSAAVGLFASSPAGRCLAGDGIVSVAVVVTDISGDTDAAALSVFAQTLLDKGILATFAISLPDRDTSDDRLAGTLRALNDLGGGVDFALDLPDLAALAPYFQSRRVYEARRQMNRLIGESDATPLLQSVLCNETEASQDPSGVRASGVLNVLTRPETSQPVRSEAWPNGVVRFYGGQWANPAEAFTFRPDDAGSENRAILYLSATSLASLPEGRLLSWATGFADTLLGQEQEGRISLMSVPDMQLRDNFGLERLIAVVLELPESASAEHRENADAFRRQLGQAGIPSAIKQHGELHWAGKVGGDTVFAPLTVNCEAKGPVELGAQAPVEPGYSLRFPSSAGGDFGLDDCAMLCLPVRYLKTGGSVSDLAGQPGGPGDRVIVVKAEQVSSAIARRRLVSDLSAIRQDPVARFVDIGKLAETLLTHGAIETRHRLTRAATVNARHATSAKLGESDRARLMEDAAHAWRYFEKYTNGTTGLCPATVDSRPGGELHQAVTMWDVGSNINGIVAATEIGLIEKDRAEKLFKRILPNITGRESQGRRLPQGWIRMDRFHWGNRDFDGCDAGRLLSSLDNMRRRFGMGKSLEKLVGSYDLDKVIINREIHSVTSRELKSTYGSHCAHYSALAFRRWGLDVASPYETFADHGPGDGEVAMLAAVARIGPLGAEPLLLEAMELGMSPESAYLADVLLSAQEEEHAASGQMICVSETPIDRSPWFIYQGLQLGAGPRSWRLDTVGHQPQYLTEEAAQEYLAFSTKAAFLWAAYRPGPYSSSLLAFAREHARNTLGFASSVNLRTQHPTDGYTDLNTNAIILQAIAHMLREPA